MIQNSYAVFGDIRVNITSVHQDTVMAYFEDGTAGLNEETWQYGLSTTTPDRPLDDASGTFPSDLHM